VNPYQRIVREGTKIQQGQIDTPEKFRQLTQGIDLKGKRVLDVGCNLGMMCRLARDAGASYVLGIDRSRDFVEQARAIWPDGKFVVKNANAATGYWNVVLASAVFHHIPDQRGFLARMARITKLLLMDVWLYPNDGAAAIFLAERGHWVPNRAAFRHMAGQHFGKVEEKGRALSPNKTERFIFHLSEPKPKPLSAVLVYGPGGAGKSTLAKSMLEHACLSLDQVFLSWKVFTNKATMSVRRFVDGVWGSDLEAKYLAHHRRYLKRWLASRQGCDVVIEGYDMTREGYREMVRGLLSELGWKTVEEIKLPRRV
jgi:SAM-dependent methyltransferase